MHKTKHPVMLALTLTMALSAALATAGCGLKGDLYLEEDAAPGAVPAAGEPAESAAAEQPLAEQPAAIPAE